jgi:hypothetical protein
MDTVYIVFIIVFSIVFFVVLLGALLIRMLKQRIMHKSVILIKELLSQDPSSDHTDDLKGNLIEFKDVSFLIKIGNREKPLEIKLCSDFSFIVGSLKYRRSNIFTYDTQPLDDLDIQILKSAGVDTSSIRKGITIEHDNAAVDVQKVIKFLSEQVKKAGYQKVVSDNKWYKFAYKKPKLSFGFFCLSQIKYTRYQIET